VWLCGVNGRTPEAVAIIPGIDAELGRRRQLRNGKRRKEQEYYTERENLRHTDDELSHEQPPPASASAPHLNLPHWQHNGKEQEYSLYVGFAIRLAEGVLTGAASGVLGSGRSKRRAPPSAHDFQAAGEQKAFPRRN
jgi:hypothetical protein